MDLLHRDLTDRIIGICYDTYNKTGTGFLERIVQTALVIALREAGLDAAERVAFPVFFRGQIIGEFCPDIVVNNIVLLEVKSKQMLISQDEAQGINYLRVSTLEVALILNFGPRPQVWRRVLSNERKAHRGVALPVDSRILKG